jgi:peptide/nickel transport system permease protein
MKWIDFKAGLRDFWNEFKRVKFGLFGLILLFMFILTVFINSYIVPFPEASSRWRDITYWEDNPVGAPPVWVNWFSSTKRAPSLIIREHAFSEEKMGKIKLTRAVFEYEYPYDLPPLDVIFHGYTIGSPVIMLSIERPDGQIVELVRRPISKSDGKIIRVSIAKDTRIESYNFGAKYEKLENNRIEREMVKPKLIAEIILTSENDVVEDIYFTFSGGVSGWLGTDSSKRDVWSGIVAGVKWALLIGLLTAFTAVSIGVIYGVTSAYLGGWKDSLMQRIFELFLGVPLLPVLIVMSAIFKPSIWILIIMMSCFFWVGPVKTVRSMGLQIKEETYIEAARAFGASSNRIIFKHMVPLLIPYAFASMALYVPRAIVVEATISLLGLGDSTIVTWGQILHDAYTGGALLNGLWWWVIPPGLFIALMGMTFAFIGFAMDKILHPKLRTR